MGKLENSAVSLFARPPTPALLAAAASPLASRMSRSQSRLYGFSSKRETARSLMFRMFSVHDSLV